MIWVIYVLAYYVISRMMLIASAILIMDIDVFSYNNTSDDAPWMM